MKWYYVAGGIVLLIWLGSTSFAPVVIALLAAGLVYQIVKPGAGSSITASASQVIPA